MPFCLSIFQGSGVCPFLQHFLKPLPTLLSFLSFLYAQGSLSCLLFHGAFRIVHYPRTLLIFSPLTKCSWVMGGEVQEMVGINCFKKMVCKEEKEPSHRYSGERGHTMIRGGRRRDENALLRRSKLISQNQEIPSMPELSQHLERMGLLRARKQGNFR